MIRLIASDMDGTILKNGAQTLPPRMFPILKELKRRGILFVAASGRQYANLRNLLGSMADSSDYVCENGAFAVHNSKIIYKSVLDRALGQALMRDIWNSDGCEIQLSGINTAYIQAKDPAYTWHLKHILTNNVTEVDDIFSTTEDYIKISAFVHGDKTQEWLKKFSKRWSGQFTLACTCDHWIDFIPPKINKGHAMKALLEILGISRDEVMAFGDNYNDMELLSCAGESYAVSDGKPEVIAACRHTCDSVEDVLESFLTSTAK